MQDCKHNRLYLVSVTLCDACVICRLYENTIVPESHRKPYLIYAYSDFCFHCMQVAPIWDQTQEDLEKIGIFWFLHHFVDITLCNTITSRIWLA